jgi:D-sedoheptulose 7-phosphate isomerase
VIESQSDGFAGTAMRCLLRKQPAVTRGGQVKLMRSWLSEYLAAQHRALDSIPLDGVEKLVNTVRQAWRDDRQIFAIGNGGNAANASHFATDLGKGASDKTGKRFRVLTLADNSAWLTALGNDYCFDDVFLRPLQNYARAGDVLIASSVSGNSPNLVRAIDWAGQNGLHTIALVGAKRGRLAEIAGQLLVIEDSHYGRVEDAQMTILHMLCYAFMDGDAA